MRGKDGETGKQEGAGMEKQGCGARMRSRDEEQGWPSTDGVNKGEGAGMK